MVGVGVCGWCMWLVYVVGVCGWGDPPNEER